LFQLFLIFFQGGRLISYLLNAGKATVWLLDLYTEPIPLSIASIKTTILLLAVCSYTIYFTTLIKLPVIKFKAPAIPGKIFFFIFLATLPFYIYKNVAYLQYIFSHGGYIAIYANNGEHLQTVGFLIRFLSNICFSSYLLYIYSEKNVSRLKKVMIFFVGIFSIELIIGLRGKYFVFLLLNLLLYRQKINKGFKFSYLAFISLFVIAASIFIAFYRENREVESDSLLADFFYTQGNSSMVSAMAVEKYEKFHPYSLNYLAGSVSSLFQQQSNYRHGEVLAADFTYYLSPEAYELGFGTGTSFIAELYLLYGIPTLILGTFIIGIIMSFLKNYLTGLAGTFSFIILMGCVYLPRAAFFDPVTGIIKYGLPCLMVYFFSIACVLLFKRKIYISN
jgi:oligosaccharide repeat unit polymerase